ncbi:hypothetical protein K6V98_07810 [Collinsella sp. AGMB00827]|uniref:CN hydrolase domain-containing protein n=1 Tax=Collinsella ureilytica TaxID=2869515 RepID=A0ABS7MLK1_9ACTN|nr:hypothetical protein [Collinsella urealyticum]MBY4798249.1 hypothetical protein [Collinsella urealyticum]
MRLALAQINARLGDIPFIFSRIQQQVEIALRKGVKALAIPTPLMTGLAPGGLIQSPNYMHDLLTALTVLAEDLEETELACFIPAIIPVSGNALLEIFLVRDGHVVPLRLLVLMGHRGPGLPQLTPPVVDIDGVRVALTLDPHQDLASLPSGTDLALYFDTTPFTVAESKARGIAGIKESGLATLAQDQGLWLACMMGVGGFDEHIFCGGSFVLDDGGKVIAASPCFEEDLLICDISRDATIPALSSDLIPVYDRHEWIWNALRLQMQDALNAEGMSRVALHITGDLPSALLAVLATDAFGPRGVIGVLIESDDTLTPWERAREDARVAQVRSIASMLHITLVERSISGPGSADSDEVRPPTALRRLKSGIEGLCLMDVACSYRALPLSSLTKTDYALASGPMVTAEVAPLAPFGDVFLTELEFLARMRNRASAVLPSELVSLEEVRRVMKRMLARSIEGTYEDEENRDRINRLLMPLEPSQIDGIIREHVEHNCTLEDITYAEYGAIAMLLVLVRYGEGPRRQLPMVPVVSARSFAERAWPVQLGWSDLGRMGAELMKIDEVANREAARVGEIFEGRAEEMRREVFSLIGGFLGLRPDQIAELESDMAQELMKHDLEGLENHLKNLGNIGGQIRPDVPGGSSEIMGGSAFFSLN